MAVKVIARKWGNSIGIIIPKETVEKEGIKEKEEIFVEIQKEKPLLVKDMLGKLKLKKTTKQLLKEIDQELDSEA